MYRVPQVKYYQGLAQIFQGYLGDAGRNIAEGLALAEEQGQKALQALGLAWQGYYYLVLGLSEAGLEKAMQAMAIANELGSPLYVMRVQVVLGGSYRHAGRLDEAVEVLESAHQVAHSMGFTPDEVTILYQLSRSYIEGQDWDKADKRLEDLLALATASEMHEYVARCLWLKSMVLSHKQEYNAALDVLVGAGNLAEAMDGRLTQYLVQIQKARIYAETDNGAAARDAVSYAQKLQRKLVESNLSDESMRESFLHTAYSVQLQEIVETLSQPISSVD
jgi:tetratricopeptide (TPR) repeat protein